MFRESVSGGVGETELTLKKDTGFHLYDLTL